MSTPEALRDVQLARTVHDRPEPLTIDNLRRRPTITIREYAAFIGSEITKWRAVIKQANMKPD